MGIFFSPVDPYFVALIIAFGAGCLMFAVRSESQMMSWYLLWWMAACRMLPPRLFYSSTEMCSTWHMCDRTSYRPALAASCKCRQSSLMPRCAAA